MKSSLRSAAMQKRLAAKSDLASLRLIGASASGTRQKRRMRQGLETAEARTNRTYGYQSNFRERRSTENIGYESTGPTARQRQHLEIRRKENYGKANRDW